MQLTIGKKLGLCFGIVILLSLLGATLTYLTVRDLVKVATPTRIVCTKLDDGIERSVEAASGHVIAGGDTFQSDRTNSLQEIASALGQLDELIARNPNSINRKRLEKIKADLSELIALQDDIENLALEGALTYSEVMRESVTAMIEEESELEATVSRKHLLKHLADSRGSLNGSLADIRAYHIAGDESSWQRFVSDWQNNQEALLQVSKHTELMTPTQRANFDRLIAYRQDFDPIPILLKEMRSTADHIAIDLNVLTDSSAERQTRLGSAVINVLLVSIILALTVSVFVVIILRSIPPRVNTLVRRAEDISLGKFDLEPLKLKSADEFSRLATAFNTMAGNLRQMISKLTKQEDLLAAEARTNAILGATADGIITIDEQGTIQSFNPMAAKMFGYSKEEAVGQNVSMLAAAPHRQQHDQYLRNYLETGIARIIGIERELEGQRKDGSTFPLALRVSELQLEAERIFIGTVQDITPRRDANNAIASAVSQLAASVHQILATTSQQATGAREQTLSVTGTVATVEELARSANEAAQRANDVAEAAKKMDAVGEKGRQLVERSAQSMIEARDQVESVADQINMLASKARSISEIISAVDDIAEQTNILALNAAVEASRAGEHGKGFSVVASQVKSLAQQSKQATENVRRLLGEIVAATQAAVLSTDQSTSLVNQASRVVIESGEAMNQLTQTIRDSAQSARQISIGVNQQAEGITQLNEATKNIEKVTQSMTLGITQIESATRDLNRLSTTLSRLTDAHE